MPRRQILTIQNPQEESQEDRQGKMLLHTEYSLLSLLHDQDGVVHHHGIFKARPPCLCVYKEGFRALICLHFANGPSMIQ